jgi:hypothetical protein
MALKLKLPPFLLPFFFSSLTQSRARPRRPAGAGHRQRGGEWEDAGTEIKLMRTLCQFAEQAPAV